MTQTSSIVSSIHAAQEILTGSRHVVALTGAGISTASGIPDFRSPESGLWAKANPMDVATIWAFRENPAAFYDWIRPLIAVAEEARPNAAHHALTDLEKYGPLEAIITQNFDGLHTEANTEVVYEVHGHTRTATCLSCSKRFDGALIRHQIRHSIAVPRCDRCGGLIKPDVVLFGENLPMDVIDQAEQSLAGCDTILVIGSSLEVAPVSEIPVRAQMSGAKIILVNQSPTPIDHRVDVLIRGNVVDILPELADPFK